MKTFELLFAVFGAGVLLGAIMQDLRSKRVLRRMSGSCRPQQRYVRFEGTDGTIYEAPTPNGPWRKART